MLVNDDRFRGLSAVRVAGVFVGVACAFALPTTEAWSQTPPAPSGGDADVVEVDGMVRSLPYASVVPADEPSVSSAKEVARLVALTGLFTTSVLKPGASAGGLVVQVTAVAEGQGQRIDAVTSRLQGATHRRTVSLAGAQSALEMARLADAVIEDLSGTRSHLSGMLLFTDASIVGERRVRAMLASGASVRDVSPAGMFARGADVGPGGVIYYAAAREGEAMRIYSEGQSTPVPVKVPGFLQAVTFTQDGLRAVVVAGVSDGGTLFRGLLGGTMEPVAAGAGIAFAPSFGPGGELAYAAGPSTGPLRVYVDGKAVSQPGAWASSPRFCNKQNHRRVVYSVRAGGASTVAIADLAGGAQLVGEGSAPACSPDGRSVALARGGASAGIFLVGEDAIASHRVREGAAADLRWSPGPSLPPEGLAPLFEAVASSPPGV